MEDDFGYSESALMNRVLFLAEYNDITIFVEDEGKEHEYENIFSRMFDDTLTINNIFPMKGKPGVEKAYREYGEKYDNKPAIYLVDGDFDLLLEKPIVNNPSFIYLEKYNIESYYVDKKAILRYVSGKLKKRQRDIINTLNYDVWLNDTHVNFQRLFLYFAIAQENQDKFPNEKNVGISEYKFLNQDGTINLEAIEEIEKKLRTKITNFEDTYAAIERKFNKKLNGDCTRLICGKYILASLVYYLRNSLKIKFKEEDFHLYLVSEFDIRKLDFIKDKINNIILQAA